MIKKTTVLIGITILSMAAIAAVPLTTLTLLKNNISDDTSESTSQSKIKYNKVTFDTDGGTTIDTILVKNGSKLSKPTDPIKIGYHVNGWKNSDKVWSFENDSITTDTTLKVDWGLDKYKINYDFNGGETSEIYNVTYDIVSDFELVKPKKYLNIFAGWYDANGNQFKCILPGMTGDLSLTAKWLDNIILKSSNENKGAVEIKMYDANTNIITVTAIHKEKKMHTFLGWYDDENNLLTEKNEYTFTLDPEKTVKLMADYMNDTEEEQWNASHGVIPVLHKGDKPYFTYGMYPQSNVNDSELITKLENSIESEINGYIYYNHEFYLKKTAKLYSSEGDHQYLNPHSFDNGVEIEEKTSYWFKVEPIKWGILENESGNYTVLSQKLLDVIQYFENANMRVIDDIDIYPNNYKYSTIRSWMNTDFLNKAFFFDNSHLLNVNVDNGAETTAVENNEFACENTNDFVYALSYKEYLKSEYGFSQNITLTPTRTFETTDLSRASGARYSTENNNLYCGYAWTRSPYYTNSETRPGLSVSRISQGGTINTSWNGANYSCAQPCINITL